MEMNIPSDLKMSKVTILVGNIASGKSTWAKQNETLISTKINQDILGSRKACLRSAEYCLDLGLDIVIDRTNISKKQRSYWIELAKKYKAEVHIVEFLSTPENCVKRALARKNHPTIKDMSVEKITIIVNNFLQEYEGISADEKFDSYSTVTIDKPTGENNTDS